MRANENRAKIYTTFVSVGHRQRDNDACIALPSPPHTLAHLQHFSGLISAPTGIGTPARPLSSARLVALSSFLSTLRSWKYRYKMLSSAAETLSHCSHHPSINPVRPPRARQHPTSSGLLHVRHGLSSHNMPRRPRFLCAVFDETRVSARQEFIASWLNLGFKDVTMCGSQPGHRCGTDVVPVHLLNSSSPECHSGLYFVWRDMASSSHGLTLYNKRSMLH